jgi:uncharacterized protein
MIIFMGAVMKIFVDTSAWFALNNRKDQNHKNARRFIESCASTPVLFFMTDYIVDETLTLLRIKISHAAAASFLALTKQSRSIVCEQASSDTLRRAEEIFLSYSDRRWSFTDCVSFAYMEQKGLKDAFTFDDDFNQFGITIHPDSGK